MVLETPRSERARVLSKGAGAAKLVLRLLEVWAIAGRGFVTAPNRTVSRTSGTMLVASLREGVAFFDFMTSRSACARPKKASLMILPRLVSGLSGSRVSPQPSHVSARE